MDLDSRLGRMEDVLTRPLEESKLAELQEAVRGWSRDELNPGSSASLAQRSVLGYVRSSDDSDDSKEDSAVEGSDARVRDSDTQDTTHDTMIKGAKELADDAGGAG
jgi:hypothetical protein